MEVGARVVRIEFGASDGVVEAQVVVGAHSGAALEPPPRPRRRGAVSVEEDEFGRRLIPQPFDGLLIRVLARETDEEDEVGLADASRAPF